MSTSRGVRLGLRREVLILLPASLLLLILLSTFTLISYRSAIQMEIEQHREQAVRLADSLTRLASERAATPELLAVSPGAVGVALLDRDGWPVMSSGDMATGNLLPDGFKGPGGYGPGEGMRDVVAGIAALAPGSDAAYVRVDLSVAVLDAQNRGLGLLTVTVVVANAAVLILVLLFLRHLMAPWEALLERARKASPEREVEGARDEVQLLVSTFERALEALAERGGDEAAAETDDDIAVLQRTLAPSLESGLLLVDRERRVLAVNAIARSLLGLGEVEVPASLETVLERHPELLHLLDEAAREEGGIRRRELSVGDASEGASEHRILGVTVHPLRRDDGGLRGSIVLFADLTEARLRARETQLAEGLERLGEMAAGIAHELRNSLATLKGYLTLIERKPDEEQIADYLAEIRHEADHLQRVLEDFLTFSRPGSVRPEEISLTALVKRATSDPALGRPPVELEVATDEDVRLVGDRQLLDRALRNLLLNAVRASAESGTTEPVRVRLEDSADEVRIEILDRGPGIAEELRERLFQPFASGFRGGVGLGLALTHRIVALHGGRVRLENRPGGGARAVMLFARGNSVTHGNDPPWLASGTG
ncbi:MAG: PAS domain-containing protein [Acidobacteria bacterium]|nr:PAS domain-containing protein [Acidobacteriota bacterium]